MLPMNTLSSTPVPSSFLPPRDAPPMPLIDYELGGIGISNASQGLMAKFWRMTWLDGNFTLDAPAVAPTVFYTRPNVTEFSFTFDENMKPFITFVDNIGAFYYWFDSTLPGYRLVEMASDVITPKCSLDDKRPHESGISDIILAYIRSGALCYRQQRDRFGIEYVLSSDIGGTLRRVGMNINYRFQFDIGHSI